MQLTAFHPPHPPSEREPKLWAAAQELEAGFLTEMLKSSGLGSPPEGFSGGIGEEQFQSFLLREYADGLVRRGGIGLAESLFESLKGADDVRQA